jgi:hypothetical protein
MRVVIKNFNMTASEMERRWAEQDNYINLLENQLRQSEEKVKKERRNFEIEMSLTRDRGCWRGRKLHKAKVRFRLE